MKRKLLIIVIMWLFAMSAANAQTGTWSGKLDVQGIKLSLVFHLDEENPTADSPDQGAKGIPIQVERKAFGGITIKIPSLGASYEGIYTIQKIAGTFRQAGLSLPLTLIPGEDKPNRPQTPQGPFPYTTEEVTFMNGNIPLNGTLVLPEGYSRTTPALIMVTGSGLQNRDEEIYDHKPFAVIADALARAGIATLRYDDRGFGGYEGNINDCTTEDFKNDALAGMDLLRKRFDKVGVIGHSEGGTIALMIATEQKADFIVSLAGMVVSGAETLVSQNRIALAQAGIDASVTDIYCKAIEEAFTATMKGSSMPDIDDYDLPAALKQNYIAVLSQIRMPYMRHFIALDMRPLLDRIACPVLALNGTKDIQVEHENNLSALRDGLPSNKKTCIEAVEGVNHLFQHCTTGTVSEYGEIEETISPAVLETIIQWIL
ncbi:MAG: alpha/beta hydrolase [Bacteroidales bacterium]|nr:alpha/beta hydrolase [Bacteroidales bacterium]